ncbi:MAG: NAD-dependent epimerase/dehydratase family protein [bacterium]|nr:NAD-dependent epimerase/dehydratase family protein [bacterium]
MNDRVALVTGAGGEMGHLLIPALRRDGYAVVALDLVELPDELRQQCSETLVASILDVDAVEDLVRRHRPGLVFHLAAVLSSKAEIDPNLAHNVNVTGTFELFRILREMSSDVPPRFIFPSSIAVYGLPDAETKKRQGAVEENEWNVPSGIYGCNKLYCELIGTYLARTRPGGGAPAIDFRAIRFPGLISAATLPTGGTTDYAPMMIHAAARGESYSCFVREDTRLPFMTMPDAIDALRLLAGACSSDLSTRVYNIRGFAASATEICERVLRHFPEAKIEFESIPARQAIADSWPEDVNDARARRDWGLDPEHDFDAAVDEYLVPALRRRYGTQDQRAAGSRGPRRCASPPDSSPGLS